MGKLIQIRERASTFIRELKIEEPVKNGVLREDVLYNATYSQIRARVAKMSPQTLGTIVCQAQVGLPVRTTLAQIKPDMSDLLERQPNGEALLQQLAVLTIMAAIFDVFLVRNRERQRDLQLGRYTREFA